MKPMLIWIPIWLLTLAMKPLLPKSHPWRRQKMTLRSWALYGTAEARAMSLMFWIIVLCLLFVRIKITTH